MMRCDSCGLSVSRLTAITWMDDDGSSRKGEAICDDCHRSIFGEVARWGATTERRLGEDTTDE